MVSPPVQQLQIPHFLNLPLLGYMEWSPGFLPMSLVGFPWSSVGLLHVGAPKAQSFDPNALPLSVLDYKNFLHEVCQSSHTRVKPPLFNSQPLLVLAE